ncbi:MAG: cytochrome c oxidase assembly protein [Pseudomonadota bacterium]
MSEKSEQSEHSDNAPVAYEGATDASDLARRHKRVAISGFTLVACMIALSFAAVPLYQLFCQVTGFGGTTQRVEANDGPVVDRMISVRFDANTSQGLKWKFRPVQHTLELKLGENKLAFYRASNPTDRPIKGTASFNVTPEIAGAYFAKIECFCFTEQTLTPGQSVDMPVSFYIDPEILDDPDARNIREITLSYTFFPVKETAQAPGSSRTDG